MGAIARIWRPPGLDGVECLRASWGRVSFDRHFHEGYALGVIEDGALGFKYLGRDVVAPAGSVNMVVPGEVHDGHAASSRGWRYRMFYLDATVVERAWAELSDGRPGIPAFPGGVIDDPALALAVRELHTRLDNGPTTLLERQAKLAGVLAAWIARHAEGGRPLMPGSEPAAVRRAREFLHANASRPVPLAELSGAAGLSGWRLTREFSRVVGLPPHAYQVRLRVEQARELLAGGANPAEAALRAGFADQSHLTRHFKRLTGFTPARYGKIVQDA